MVPRKVALVLPQEESFAQVGGVASVAKFLLGTYAASSDYTSDIVTIAASFNERNSIRLLSPRSWLRGIQITHEYYLNVPAIRVGSELAEFEFQRYMPRYQLTEILNQYDLVQVVAGMPAIAHVTRNVTKPVCLFMATLARLERKPILRRANLARKVYGHLMMPFVTNIEKQALSRVDHIFAETAYTRQAILPYVDKDKVTIDTIGVDTQIFRPVAEERRTDDYILSVGRFEDARKNIVLLFEAYALLRQHMPDAPKLILAGKTAPTLAAWARARALGITAHVEFKQGVSFGELVALYQHAAVYALSSDEEGLGIVLLEAMACATPVVSTRCGGPESVVSEEVGILTPLGDEQALADQLFWMLQNPVQRRKMGQAGRQMVEARFSSEVVGRKYLSVYDRLLEVEIQK